MKPIVFIKLGGSLITDKEIPYHVRRSVIRSLSSQIREIVTQKKELSFVLGNGAGSFGHCPAKEYKVMSGIDTDQKTFGFCKVQHSVATLNRIVMDRLVKDGVRAVSIHPSSIMVSNNGVPHIFTESIFGILNLGIIPVVYGDIVYDSSYGCKIFSTEDIFSILIKVCIQKHIPIHAVVHLGIVDGVLDENGRIIKHITRSVYPSIQKNLFIPKGYDVTGGMKHKIEQALQISKYGIQTCIINGLTKENLKTFFLKNVCTGTTIR